MSRFVSYACADTGVRYHSGMLAYDEKMAFGRLVPRYINACGQILPEMHLSDALFSAPVENVFSLTVNGKRLDCGWELLRTEADAERAYVYLRHSSEPIEVVVETRADGKNWLSRELSIKNVGDTMLAVEEVQPLCGKLWRHRFANGILSYQPEECGATPDSIFEVGYAEQCKWGLEGDFAFRPLREDLVYNGGFNGRSGWSRPAFVLKDNLNGQLFCCEFGYSGNWKMALRPSVSEENAVVSFAIGIAAPEGECARVLQPAETVRTPAVHFTLCAEGAQALTQSRHRFVREEIMPKADPIGACLIEANHRGYLCDRENENGIIQDMDVAAKAGVELYVIDAGWYGKEPNVWFNNVGDWQAGNWLPNDLYPLIGHAKMLGMKFGLWMEIEAAGPNSDVRLNHPEYFLKRDGKPCADGRALDLSNPETVQWVETQIRDVIKRYRLDMFRIDHNHYLMEGGNRQIGGVTENLTWRYYENLYAMFERLTRDFPRVSFQNCAAGGGRLDLGILRYFHHTEISDWARPPRDLRIFNGMLSQLPPEILLRICGTEVCEHVQASDMISQLHSIMQGRMIFRGIAPSEADITPELLQTICVRTILYRNYLRSILIGNCVVYQHEQPEGVLAATPFSANEYALPDKSKAFAVVHRLSASAGSKYRLFFKGLCPDRQYRVLCDRSVETFVMSGLELMQNGLMLHLENNLSSELVYVETAK